MMTKTTSLSARLHESALPHFGQTINWVLIAICFILGSLSFDISSGVRQSPVTVLSWMPEAWLSAPLSFHIMRTLLWCGALLWLLGWATPWSCWLATLSFTGLWSLHMENTTNGAHIFNVSNQLLIVQSLWMTINNREIKLAIKNGKFWSTELYPNWVFWLGIGFIGLFHSYAGLAKIMHSGIEWPNGTSLQLWAYWDGRPGSWTRELMIQNRSFAIIMQWATLIFETAGILALFNRNIRLVVGMALLSFYIGVVFTFDYGFHINLALTALYHLPFDRWLPLYFSKKTTAVTKSV
jgi:hypothetical protein